MSYQKIILVGNLGRDPEMRYTPDGTPVTSFSMAVNRRWTNSDGSQGEETAWFRVTAWRRLAETAAQYLHKGQQVMVDGQLSPDRATGGPKVYQKRDGTYGASYEVRAFRIVFLGSRSDTGMGAPGGMVEEPEGSYEEDIPF